MLMLILLELSNHKGDCNRQVTLTESHRGSPQEPGGEAGAQGPRGAGGEGELPRGPQHVPEHIREQLPEQELGQDRTAEHCHHTG